MNSSNVVKCANCNVVINEMLAFVCNKLDVMDEESLSRICLSAFSDSDIVEAKNLLFSAIQTTKRKITRKKDGKKLRDIDDIMSLLQVTHPDERPVFVAKDLHKLPPVLFDHVDVTKLLKDITILKRELLEIKTNCVTVHQLQPVISDVDTLKKHCYIKSDTYVNTKRGAAYISMDNCDCDSGPMGLQHISMAHETPEMQTSYINQGSANKLSPTHFVLLSADQNVTNKIKLSERRVSETGFKTAVKNDHIFERGQTTQSSENIVELCMGHTAAMVNAQNKQEKTLAEIVKDGEWTTVQKKKKNRFVGNIGKAIIDPHGKFKAVDEKAIIYIYNVDKNVESNDIEEYVEGKVNIAVSVQKMKMKLQKTYNAFKIYVPKHKFDLFMSDDFWPEGISYRKFIEFGEQAE